MSHTSRSKYIKEYITIKESKKVKEMVKKKKSFTEVSCPLKQQTLRSGCGSPLSLLFTAQAVLRSFPPRAGDGARVPLETAAGFLLAFMVASSEVSASSGNGARRLDERPCLRV